jgi:hypothetical protein
MSFMPSPIVPSMMAMTVALVIARVMLAMRVMTPFMVTMTAFAFASLPVMLALALVSRAGREFVVIQYEITIESTRIYASNAPGVAIMFLCGAIISHHAPSTLFVAVSSARSRRTHAHRISRFWT